jgi:hypothetical protein
MIMAVAAAPVSRADILSRLDATVRIQVVFWWRIMPRFFQVEKRGVIPSTGDKRGIIPSMGNKREVIPSTRDDRKPRSLKR